MRSGTAPGALVTGLLLLTAALTVPRRPRADVVRAVLRPRLIPAPDGPGAVAAVGARPTWRDVWTCDPVELVRRWRGARRRDHLLDEALAVLDATAAGLRAGLEPGRALAVAVASAGGGPGAGERAGGLVGLVRLVGLVGGAASDGALASAGGTASGAPVGSGVSGVSGAPRGVAGAWADTARAARSADIAFVAAAWELSESTGAPLAEAAERGAEGLRDARERRRRVAAAVAGPRATVAVLTALPLTGPFFGLACGLGPGDLYAASPVPTVCAAAGVGLLVVGRLWCRRLVRAAEGP